MTEMFQQNTDVETAALQEEAILFNPKLNKFCMLNRTSSFIWGRLKTPCTLEQVAKDVTATFTDVSAEQAIEDTRKILKEFVSLGVVRCD